MSFRHKNPPAFLLRWVIGEDATNDTPVFEADTNDAPIGVFYDRTWALECLIAQNNHQQLVDLLRRCVPYVDCVTQLGYDVNQRLFLIDEETAKRIP